MHAAMASAFRHDTASPNVSIEVSSVARGAVALRMVLMLTLVYDKDVLNVHYAIKYRGPSCAKVRQEQGRVGA